MNRSIGPLGCLNYYIKKFVLILGWLGGRVGGGGNTRELINLTCLADTEASSPITINLHVTVVTKVYVSF